MLSSCLLLSFLFSYYSIQFVLSRHILNLDSVPQILLIYFYRCSKTMHAMKVGRHTENEKGRNDKKDNQRYADDTALIAENEKGLHLKQKKTT